MTTSHAGSAAAATDYRPRNRRAYTAGRQARAAGLISAEVLDTFNRLVKECKAATFTTITEAELAAACGLAPRTIQNHLRRMRDAGLIRIEPAGNLRRKCITAFDLNDPQHDPPAELQVENDPDVLLALAAQEPDVERAMRLAYQAAMLKAGKPLDPRVLHAPGAAFFAPDLNDPDCVLLTQPGSSSTFKQDRNGDLNGPPQGDGGGRHDQRRGFFRREEPAIPETPTTKLLQAIGVRSAATLRRLAALDAAYVERQLEAARRSGRARDLAAFVVHVLDAGGVWGAGPAPGMDPDPPLASRRLRYDDLVRARQEQERGAPPPTPPDDPPRRTYAQLLSDHHAGKRIKLADLIAARAEEERRATPEHG